MLMGHSEAVMCAAWSPVNEFILATVRLHWHIVKRTCHFDWPSARESHSLMRMRASAGLEGLQRAGVGHPPLGPDGVPDQL